MLTETRFFADYIQQELGIVYTDFNHYQLRNRLEAMAREFCYPDVHAFYQNVRHHMDPLIRQHLLDLATNNETAFFRDAECFGLIEKVVLPQLFTHTRLRRASHNPISMWSCASSTGQEPYSLSMCVDDYLAQRQLQADAYEILATDVSMRALKRALTARYSEAEMKRGLNQERIAQHFIRCGREWLLQSPIQRRVRFSKRNLVDSFSQLGPFDLILCRNVLIYQSLESKIDIILRLTSTLNPGGFLVLGRGESLIGLSDAFHVINHGNCLAYQLKDTDQEIMVQ